MTLFAHTIRPENVAELIDFSGGDRDLEAIRDLQNEGVAALYNILRERRFAYLADEVGMGKTFQAIGLAAVLWHIDPRARVVFITPRKVLQHQWERDYRAFFERNYRPHGLTADDRGVSALLGTPAEAPLFENLRDFAGALGPDAPRSFILRHTSFCRPVFLRQSSTPDVRAGWERTCQVMHECGLPEPQQPQPLPPPPVASAVFNGLFAEGLNQRLREWAGDGGIDLLIVDEAQALRHHCNQTNENFARVFKGVVKHWLFLSATPLHNGPGTVKAVCHYAAPQAIRPEDCAPERLTALAEVMKGFLVRRPRTYRSAGGDVLTKGDYRDHRLQAHDGAQGVPGLAMALVQKHLARILQSQGNRFQVGFLTSFESLRRSTLHLDPEAKAEAEAEEGEPVPAGAGDDHLNLQRHDAQRAQPQPDAGAIAGIVQRFSQRFPKHTLPHPKLNAVARDLADLAFVRGEKVLVFMRRIAAVDELCEHLERAFHKSVETRVHNHWKDPAFDWAKGPSSRLPEGEDAGSDDDGGKDGGDRMDDLPGRLADGFRRAFREGGWLHLYRRRFETDRSLGLFFEENWFLLLAPLYGRDPAAWAAAVPRTLWSQAAGLSPARRRAFILHHMLTGNAEVLGIPAEVAQVWAEALALYHPQVKRRRAVASGHPQPEPSLLLGEGFWDVLRRRSPDWWPGLEDRLAGAAPEQLRDLIHRRQLAKNWIGQSIRLSDALIDLHYIDAGLDQARAASTPVAHAHALAEGFLDWLSSAEPAALTQRRSFAAWAAERELILQTCFGGSGPTLADLAAAGSTSQLNNQVPVIGVVGGSDVNERALVQFKTPAYPRVLVCTDVLKEGANLHTFCDRVMHYGVAWTAGDLEQRIGRVDRFRSLIERRLRQNGDGERPKLDIAYPYLDQTLEQRQVNRVRSTMKTVEHLLDGLSAGGKDERWTLSTLPDATLPAPLRAQTAAGHFVPVWDGVAGRPFVRLMVDPERQREAFHRFAEWIRETAEDAGLTVHDEPSDFRRPFRLTGPSGLDLTCRWFFRPDWKGHVLDMAGTPAAGLEAVAWTLILRGAPGHGEREWIADRLRVAIDIGRTLVEADDGG